jgi:hypothetical protein
MAQGPSARTPETFSAFAVTTIHLHFLPLVQMAVEDGKSSGVPAALNALGPWAIREG